ncbi:MAG: hypothetical protein LQ338_000627 [Usnochroma carphineum]|nr:MAG: hypothetical protein LQ338_000627 [Usnochroma carphineum]
MAPTTSSQPTAPQPPPPKLRRLPSNARIHKRPLLHPPIPSPYASSSQQKVVYISTHTPFISAVKRVRKLLSLVEARSTQSSSSKIDLVNGKGSDREKLRALERSIDAEGKGKQGEEVILKATNRAIEKALGLAVFFQGQEGFRVRLRTGTVGAVDDVEEMEKPKKPRRKNEAGRKGKGGKKSGQEEARPTEEGVAEEGELPETQIRKVSVLEVAITLK